MTEFDFAVMAIFLVSLLLGLWRGFIHEVLSLLGWPIAFLLSNIYTDNIARLIPLTQDALRLTVVYALLFVVVLIAWGVLVMLLAKLLKMIGTGWPDRMLGGMFGVLRGGLVVLVLVWLAGMTAIPEQQFWRNAQTSKVAEDVALLTKAWLPDNIAHSVRYRIRS
ncbi:MAG: CvpA family protein [Gallionella sp.]|nr:CvpA family protein [Gallionella sp.]MDH4286980.1 CvpA family protein [Gallionella sp.]